MARRRATRPVCTRSIEQRYRAPACREAARHRRPCGSPAWKRGRRKAHREAVLSLASRNIYFDAGRCFFARSPANLVVPLSRSSLLVVARRRRRPRFARVSRAGSHVDRTKQSVVIATLARVAPTPHAESSVLHC